MKVTISGVWECMNAVADMKCMLSVLKQKEATQKKHPKLSEGWRDLTHWRLGRQAEVTRKYLPGDPSYLSGTSAKDLQDTQMTHTPSTHRAKATGSGTITASTTSSSPSTNNVTFIVIFQSCLHLFVTLVHPKHLQYIVCSFVCCWQW